MPTFGKTTDGTAETSSSVDKKKVNPQTASSNGIAISISIRGRVTVENTVIKGIIYADNAGVPGALLAVSDEITINSTTAQWWTGNLSGANQINITNGTTYQIGFIQKDPGTGFFAIRRDGTSGVCPQNADTYSDGPSDPFGTDAGSEAGPIAVYVTTALSGAVALTQTPTFTASGTVTSGAIQGAVSLTESPTLTASGTLITQGAVSLTASTTIEASGRTGQVIESATVTMAVAGVVTPPQAPNIFTTSNAREMATYVIILEGTGDIRQGVVSLTAQTSFLSGVIVGAGAVVATATYEIFITPKQIVPIFPISGTFVTTNADNTAAYIFVLESPAVTYPGQVSMVATATIEAEEYRVQGAVSLVATPVLTAKAENFGYALLTQSPTILIIPFINERFAQVVIPTLTIQGPIYRAEAQVQLSAIVAFRVAARRQKFPILRTQYPYPALPHGFRVIAQKILTGEIIDWELPVSDDFEYTRQLSGPTVMKGSFKPEIRSVQELNLDGYAVMFHVEIDNVIRASGILLPPQYAESSLEFTCEGIAAVPHYVTWESSFSGIGVDAFDIVRKIWQHVQAIPTSNLGVELPTVVSGRTFGTAAGVEIIDANNNVVQTLIEPERIRAARAILERLSSISPQQPIYADWSWDGMPDIVATWHIDLLNDYTANGPQPIPADPTAPNSQTWLTKLIADYITSVVPEGDKTREKEAEPYELQWWNGINCGEEFDKLAGDTPFDYIEGMEWNEDKTDVDFFLDLGYPRLGSQRTDLLFNEDNILEVVPAQEGEDTYASAILVVGSGEGAATIRGYASQSFGERIRKTVVVTDKSITTTERANTTALAELGIRRGKTFEITELVCAANHQNAPLGTYDLGDDIVVEVFVPWLNYWHRDWYRITSITYQPNRDHVRLGVQRSDSFRYPVLEMGAVQTTGGGNPSDNPGNGGGNSNVSLQTRTAAVSLISSPILSVAGTIVKSGTVSLTAVGILNADPLSAAMLLGRSVIVTPTGTFTTTYQVASPTAQTTYDMRGAEFVSYHDKDAVYETNSFAGGSTTHQKNHRPIRLGYTTSATELALIGGIVHGDQPETLPWVRMKYGQNIQDDTDVWVDAGRPIEIDPYANIVNNENQDGDPRIYVAPGSWAVVNGARVRNTHDGFGLFGINVAGNDGAGTVYMRNCWFQDIHDDALENDEWQTLYVRDCLFDRVYSLVSTRPSAAGMTGSAGSAKVVRIEDCVVQLSPFPGGHKQRSTAANHGTILKIDDNSPRHEIINTIIRVDGPFIDSGAAQLPARQVANGDAVTDVYQNVTIVWTGGGAYPGNIPTGCTLITDTAPHNTSVANWKSRHGVTDFFNVNYALLLSPNPTP